MKVKQIVPLVQKTGSNSEKVAELMSQIGNSIAQMQHPAGSGEFRLYNERKGNGVKPIKDTFLVDLLRYEWLLEHRVDVGVTNTRPGPIDAVSRVGDKLFAMEWETGNISSSHRAINKMVIGMLRKQLIGGVLILPSREMYEYLTDRIGNFRELAPYFDVWQMANYEIEEGYLYVIEIEHHGLTDDPSCRISKGTDGRALI
ncbi:hypothetical protein KQI74_12855 [Paenibacillus barcinonensis]|uniref:hypothetical protein n=1 Tax=Paenibacillus barcinonensis TaxID=198119 RepID=UPI001C11D100|nr:hypothetical protein [Paenibacillus barcinonensis]MBU5353181.1 hypothetical protein [Paenibacillus barcinonensis]